MRVIAKRWVSGILAHYICRDVFRPDADAARDFLEKVVSKLESFDTEVTRWPAV